MIYREQFLFNILPFSQDYLQLGKVELKLLNVTGQQMPIHVPIQPSEAEIQAKQCNPDTWPVTQPMLKQAASS